MATYQLAADAIAGKAYSGVIRTADGRWVANAAGSSDWADYITWLETPANVPDSYKSPSEGGATIVLEEGQEAFGAMLPSMPDAVWAAVPVSAPVVVDTPSIMGTPVVGEELQCTWGNWQYEPTMYSGQWLRNNTIQVGVGEKYTVQSADVGHTITCTVTAENALGFTVAPPSNPVVVTEAVTPPVTRSAERQVPRQPPPTTRSEPPPPPPPASKK
jgi:hypothetical protein